MIKKTASILGIVALVPLTFVGLASLFSYSSTNFGVGATLGAIVAVAVLGIAGINYLIVVADNNARAKWDAEMNAIAKKAKG